MYFYRPQPTASNFFWENICLSKCIGILWLYKQSKYKLTALLQRRQWRSDAGTRKISIHLTFNMPTYTNETLTAFIHLQVGSQSTITSIECVLTEPSRAEHSFCVLLCWLYRYECLSWGKILWSQMFSIVSLLHIYWLYFICTERFFFFVFCSRIVEVFLFLSHSRWLDIFFWDFGTMFRLFCCFFALLLCIIVFW